VTTNRVQRTVRIFVLSTFLALVAFAFLAFGSASAHTLNHPINSAQAASSGTSTVSRIVTNSQGGAVFSPSAITIKSGSFLKIVNKTTFSRIVFADRVVRLAPGGTYTFVPAQSMTVGICGGGGLTVTVV
jgi:hypothetical protein